ncbi:MAG TPA: hypothetical protein VLL97_11170 [Acidobacteriota bacterium]|nr:hypothetical protein [Acidobacteriota bacterium]
MRFNFRYFIIVTIVAALYLGWTFYSRRSQNQALIQKMEAAKAEEEKGIIDAYGGGKATILSFYAVPGVVSRGETVQLCYGVSYSRNIRMEPYVEGVWPSRNRCVEVRPVKDTVYTLTAEDDEGNIVTAEVAVIVK